jgi:hypothetical protein
VCFEQRWKLCAAMIAAHDGAPVHRDGQLGARGRVFVPVPFGPDQVWGIRGHHHITGTVNEMRVRGVIELVGADGGVVLGEDCGMAPGHLVEIVVSPEGLQRDDLADDIAADCRRHAESPLAGGCWSISLEPVAGRRSGRTAGTAHIIPRPANVAERSLTGFTAATVWSVLAALLRQLLVWLPPGARRPGRVGHS